MKNFVNKILITFLFLSISNNNCFCSNVNHSQISPLLEKEIKCSIWDVTVSLKNIKENDLESKIKANDEIQKQINHLKQIINQKQITDEWLKETINERVYIQQKHKDILIKLLDDEEVELISKADIECYKLKEKEKTKQIVEKFLNRKKPKEILFIKALFNKKLNTAQKILEQDQININSISIIDNGIIKTLLTIAIETVNLEITSFLLDNGALIRKVDLKGNSALHHAVKNGAVRILSLLIQKLDEMENNILSEELLRQNKDGLTPLSLGNNSDIRRIIVQTIQNNW